MNNYLKFERVIVASKAFRTNNPLWYHLYDGNGYPSTKNVNFSSPPRRAARRVPCHPGCLIIYIFSKGIILGN